MRDILLTVFIFSMLPIGLWRPYIGLLVWAWIGYMNPHRLTWGFAYSMPFVQLAAISTLVGLIFTKDRRALPVTTTTVIWILFIGWMCITTLFALNPESAYSELSRTLKIQVMVLATLMLINTPKKLNYLVWIIVLSIGFYGIKGGIFTIITGGNFKVWGPPQSFIYGNNEIAFAMLISLPLMWYLYLSSSSKLLKLFIIAMTLLTGVSILGSYSRGAILGTAAMLLMLWLKSRKKIIIAIPILLIGAISLNFMPEEWMQRIESIQDYEEDKSAMGRINSWNFAINIANDRPLIGGGYKVFTKELFLQYAPDPTDHHDAHSIYFEVLGEHGYVGLLLYLALGFVVVLSLQKVIYTTKQIKDLKWLSDLAAMIQVCFVGYAAGGAFLGLAYFDLPYHFMAISIILSKLTAEALLKADDNNSLVSKIDDDSVVNELEYGAAGKNPYRNIYK